MFYSNQILTSTQYGVSTIWLVATIGKSHQKRVTKRAIQDVNVPRACDKILDPGAPLALRLQGNLLYGVSRVFADQCGYLLSDTEKTQNDMMTFFRAIKSSHLDLADTKTKRVSITLQDDPNFDPMSQLPPLDLNIIDTDWLAVPSQGSSNKYSQMTPLQAYASRHGSLNRGTSLINIELPPSSQSGGSFRLHSQLGQSSSPYAKAGHFDDVPEFIAAQDDTYDAIADIGLNFDGDGNLIEPAEDDLQLPPFFGDMPSNVSLPASGAQHLQPLEDFLVVGEEQVLPDAEAFPSQAVPQKRDAIVASDENEPVTTSDVVQVVATAKRRKITKKVAMVDQDISIPRSLQKHWLSNYADIVADAAKPHRGGTAPGQAKKNALNFIIHNGIASVGLSSRTTNVPHPLSSQFSGWNVLSQLNPDFFGPPDPVTPSRQRRRKSADAFDDDAEQQQRNVRPRFDYDNAAAETGRGLHADDQQELPIFGSQDDSHFEMGMDALPPMDDHHSSSFMPWSRQGSAAPGSSVRAPPGSAQKAQPSPLLHKSTNLIAGLDRHSDPAEPPTPFRGAVAADLSDVDAFMDMDPVLNFDDGAYAGLDAASQEFLDYASKRAVAHGQDPASSASPSSSERRWIEFEHIANPLKHDGAVAAQAFLHVLSLATRGVVSVRQYSNEEGTEPFGTIHVGIKFSSSSEK